MKTRTLVLILILVLAVLVIAGSCATGNKVYIATKNEELYGTWVNTDYEGTRHNQKWTFYKWGYIEGFYMIADQRPGAWGTFFIVDKWTDPEGNIWYKDHERYRNSMSVRFYLIKINNNKGVMEAVWSYNDFPSQLDPKNVNYVIYYRQ